MYMSKKAFINIRLVSLSDRGILGFIGLIALTFQACLYVHIAYRY